MGEEEEAGSVPPAAYVSPVAEPLLDGKALKRSLKLIQAVASREKISRNKSKENGGEGARKTVKLLRRGVHEVTKSLRKGEKGIVFFASDVYPIEITAHLPILCEEKGVTYAYICPKKALGHAFKSKRPASVIMVMNPGKGQTAAAGQEEEEVLQACDLKFICFDGWRLLIVDWAPVGKARRTSFKCQFGEKLSFLGQGSIVFCMW
ncbi:hypothetical protein Esti_005119 [Eimeria stiedai]